MTRCAILLTTVLALALTVPLASCGFTPLYASPGVSPGLSSIEVIAPQGRVGFLLRESLDDALGHRPRTQPSWRLDLSLDQTRGPLGLRIDDVARRYQVTLTVQFSLVDVANGQVAHRGVATSFASYDVADQPYAAIAARQDVQQRAADEVARKIQMDLAAFMVARNSGS